MHRVVLDGRLGRLGDELVHLVRSSRIAKLAIIGAIASLIDYFILSILVIVGLPIWFAGAIGYTLGTLIVYFVANRFVFNQTRARYPALEIALFLITGALGLVMNSVILEIATNYFYLQLVFAKLISIVIVFAWNTFARITIISLLRIQIDKAGD